MNPVPAIPALLAADPVSGVRTSAVITNTPTARIPKVATSNEEPASHHTPAPASASATATPATRPVSPSIATYVAKPATQQPSDASAELSCSRRRSSASTTAAPSRMTAALVPVLTGAARPISPQFASVSSATAPSSSAPPM